MNSRRQMTKLNTAGFLLFLICIWLPVITLAQQGGTTRYLYDDNGRLRAVISPTGEANVYEYDAAGNFTAIKKLTADTLSVLDFSPRAGVVGDRVTLLGTGFGGGVNAVAFNGVSARVISTTATVLVVEVPFGATTGKLAVTTSRGTAITTESFLLQGIRLTPANSVIVSGDRIEFNAEVVLDGNTSLRWTVNGIEGGNVEVGTISGAGVYNAPARASLPPISAALIRATSAANPAVFGDAQVFIKNSEFLQPALSTGISVRRGATVTAIASVSNGVSVRRGATITTVASVSGGISVRRGATNTQLTPFSPPVSVTKGPSISGITPLLLAKGANTTVTITGANLNGVTGLLFLTATGQQDTTITASGITINSGGTSLSANISVGAATATGQRIVIVAKSSNHSSTLDSGLNKIEIVP